MGAHSTPTGETADLTARADPGSGWFLASPVAYRRILMVADAALVPTLLLSLRVLAAAGDNLPLFARGLFLAQELLADALLLIATSIAFTKYHANERSLTMRPPIGRRVTVGIVSIHSIE